MSAYRCALVAVILCFSGSAARCTEVRVVSHVTVRPLPAGAVAPSAVVDDAGVLHVVFARDGNAFYMRSADHGRSFSTPVCINQAATVGAGGERGPKLARDGKGNLHVIYQVKWYPGMSRDQFALWYARSTDGGQHWTERKLVSAPLDNINLAAAGSGTVVATWTQGEIRVACSTDGGLTFDEPHGVRANVSTLPCECCRLEPRLSADGRTLYLVYRGRENNLRDMYLLHGSSEGGEMQGVRISPDNWNLAACPMDGASLALAGSEITVAWRSRDTVFVAKSADGNSFTRLPGAARGRTGKWPEVAVNRRGETLLTYCAGSDLRWELFDAAGNSVRRGTFPDNDGRPAVVTFGDDFLIIAAQR